MSIIEAIILGLIQGLTEFIPISSTAHLTLAGKLMGLIDPNNPEQWTIFMAVIQLGTILAVLVYFRKDLIDMTRDFIKENFSRQRKKISEQSLNARLAWLIMFGSVPVVVVGLALKKTIEGGFTKDPYVIGTSLIVLAFVLYIAEKYANFHREMKDISFKDAIIIGLAQCIALIPGSSRSGTTITAGLFLGMTRETAAKFSFLLSIPAILGSGLLELKDAVELMHASDLTAMLVATIVSALSGYASIAFLLRYLRSNSTFLFINYRIIVGVIVLILASNGLL